MRFETAATGGDLPVLSFSDSFTRANGNLGTDWSTQLRSNGTGVVSDCTNWPQFSVNNNKLNISTQGNNTANRAPGMLAIPRKLITANSNGPSGIWARSQFVELTFQTLTVTSGCRLGTGLLSRFDMGGSVAEAQGYFFMVNFNAGAFAAVQLLECVGGDNEPGNTFNVLGTNAVAPVGGDVFRLEALVTGTTTVTVTLKKNGTQILQATDNSPLIGGYPSFGLLDSIGTLSSTWTNFSCGVL